MHAMPSEFLVTAVAYGICSTWAGGDSNLTEAATDKLRYMSAPQQENELVRAHFFLRVFVILRYHLFRKFSGA